jgi:hypothetical protein
VGRRVRTHVCFTVGQVVDWFSAILFGNIIAEPPIVMDYLKKTGGNFLPTGPQQPERDWWDEGPLTERAKSYEDILRRRKHGMSEAALKELARGKMPDLLTYKGFTAAQIASGAGGVGRRHEYYEIKPRSLSGIEKGAEKIAWLKKAYAANGLPYVGGSLYPRYFYPTTDGRVELPMLMMDERHKDDWEVARERIKRRLKLTLAELTLEVRPSPTVQGLLLYRICVTKEFDEDDELTDAQVIRAARELVNAFVMSATPMEPRDVYREVTRVGRSLDPQMLEHSGKPTRETFYPSKTPPITFPLVNIKLEGVPAVVLPATGALRDAVNTRRLGLPGDRLMLCCDEEFYQSSIAPPGLLAFIHYIRSTPIRWTTYARERGGAGILDAVQEANEIADLAKAAGTASFQPLVDWSKKNPGEAVLIGVGIIVVSALAFWALPALLTELAALEAASLAATSAGLSQTFIETAAMSAAMMEEATALELASAAQVELDAAIVSAADQVAINAIRAEALAVGSATGAAASASAAAVTMEQLLLRQAGTAIAKRLVQESLKATTSQLVATGIGTTVALATRTAMATPAGMQGGGKPTPSNEAFTVPIGSQDTRMFMLRPEPAPARPWPGPDTPPSKRKPFSGEWIDAVKFSPQAAAQAKALGQTTAFCRYLGEVVIS